MTFMKRYYNFSRLLNKLYEQGQSPSPKIREYFYFIDHQGQLFLDDTKIKNFTSCFKDEKFLKFFYSNMKLNTSDRYQKEFPYISHCGKEVNYIKCDDRPIVFTQLVTLDDATPHRDILVYGGKLKTLYVGFEPSELCMLPASGRLYHPAPLKYGGVGLVKSSIAIDISKYFEYDPPSDETKQPIAFVWRGIKHKLTNNLQQAVERTHL